MMFNNNLVGIFNRKRVNKADRPVIRPEKTPVDWLLDVVALIGLMVFMGFVIYQFPKLPGNIPSHFDAAGNPDSYSDKSTFWILPGVAVFIYILLSLIVLVPHQFNYTVRISPGNALSQYTMAVRLIRYFKAALIWMFFSISLATFRISAGESPGLGVWFMPVALAAIFIPLIIYFISAHRKQ